MFTAPTRLGQLVGLALTLAAAAVVAQAPAIPPPRGPSDVREVEAFIDGLMASYLTDKHIAGATVSIVRDTAVLFAKGYGSADVAKQTPVNAATTLFRIGSITKMFTWTAVMQLVEQGKLDLGADINTYLDFKIPATFTAPITLKHVLTHTPGFEEDSRDLFTEDSSHITPLRSWLPAHMPKRVRPPGVHSSYSNWATAVAGYIVQRVSGLAYDEYVERYVLQPLGMQYASSRQPLPSALVPHMSRGYSWAAGRWEAKPWEMVTGAWPAGSMSVSAVDMGAFMIAHLNRGAYRGQRILAESTAVQMQTRIQGHDPRISGFAHGFYEQNTRGPRAIGHGGDTQWFHSDMVLLPSERVGLFVSFNTNTGGVVSFKPFADRFLEHYYSEPLAPLAPVRDDRRANARFAGEYLMNRMSYSTFQKAFSLQGAITIAVSDSGSLVANTPFGAVRMVQVDSLLFRDVTSHDLLAFKADESGAITHAFLSMLPMMTLERVSGVRSPSVHRVLLGLGVVVFLGIIGAAVVRFFGQKASGRAPADALTVRGRRLMVAAALLVVAFLAAVAVIASNPAKLMLGNDFGALKAALALPVLAAVVVLGAAGVLVLQWVRGAGSLATRVRHSLAVTVALVFFWSLNTWNLLGWKF